MFIHDRLTVSQIDIVKRTIRKAEHRKKKLKSDKYRSTSRENKKGMIRVHLRRKKTVAMSMLRVAESISAANTLLRLVFTLSTLHIIY